MSRVQLALNVPDIDRAVQFYSMLFDVTPHKTRPGYANFIVEEPPLKLVLIENVNPGSALNHLGIEVATASEVVSAKQRLEAAGLEPHEEADVECCFARQIKVWVGAPDGEPWEIYTVLDDLDGALAIRHDATNSAVCCAPLESADPAGSACC